MWNVYYSERGVKTTNKFFKTESEACEYIYNELVGKEDKNSMKNKKIIVISVLAVLGTLIFMGGLVALCMLNFVIGMIVFAVVVVLMIVLAEIRNRKQGIQENQQLGQDLNKLFDIAADFDGYDMVFVQGKTNPDVYNDISLILSDSKYNIKNLSEFNNLTTNSSEDEFYEFYDRWTKDLENSRFLVPLNKDTTMQDFANAIVKVLIQNGYQTDISVDNLVKKYTDYLSEIEMNSTIKYDILEANIVAGELRKYDLELISFFDGFDNTEFAVISSSNIERLKDLERRIK